MFLYSQRWFKATALHCRQQEKRRKRTIFTCEQLNRLESEFADQQYMVGAERQQLAEALNLSETQVKFLLYYLFHFLKCQEN